MRLFGRFGRDVWFCMGSQPFKFFKIVVNGFAYFCLLCSLFCCFAFKHEKTVQIRFCGFFPEP